MFRLRNCPLLLTEIRLECSSKQFKQDLETDLCDGGVVPSFAQLVPYEGVLGPREFMEAEDDVGFAQFGADQVSALVGDMGVLDAEYHGHFALELVE